MTGKPWLKMYPDNVAPTIQVGDNEHLAGLFEDACQKYSSRIALSCMGVDITFRQCERLAAEFASFLQHEIGLQKGDRFAIMLPNIAQFPIALFAAAKLGVICVNTNPLYTPREMRHQFKDSGAKAIVIMDLFVNKLEEILPETDISAVIVTSIGDQLPLWKGVAVDLALKIKGVVPKTHLKTYRFREALEKGARLSYERPHMEADDIAILQYTGGTTGISKGAVLTHRNLLSNVRQLQEWSKFYVEKGSETILTALPLYHIFALSVNFISFFTIGGRSILVPRPVPIENTAKIFKRYKITAMTGINTLFNALNNSDDFRKTFSRELKFAMAGGMALQTSVSEDFQRITGVRIIEGYGLTEASPVTHCNPLRHDLPVGSIGVPMPSTEAKIVDDDGKELGVGQVGELVVRGPQVMQGYWQRDDETAKVLKDGWLFTGDIARMDESGFFYIVDRKKDMILVSGFNVYPNEIEGVLVSHPKVLEAAVIGIPDSHSGESVKAFVVKKDESLTEAELKAYCDKNLTGYKRPKSYAFTKDLPKSNVGKILRRELREQQVGNSTKA